MSSKINSIKEFINSEGFILQYNDYLVKQNNSLQSFLDNIDINKKYYRMNINKNKKYVKTTTEDTSTIKEINSMINKLTDINYEVLKKQIIDKITVNHIIPYIIEKLAESSIKHHIYIPLYVGILKEIKSVKKNMILIKLCNKYHTEFFYSFDNNAESSYEKLCDNNKNTDNIIGFSLFISHLEKEDIINNFIEKVLDQYMENIIDKNDIELYKMLVSFENISNIHYSNIPKKYKLILDSIKSQTKSSKIRFKVMDILKE